MKIGIDISQIIYEGTGVARYTKLLVEALTNTDTDDELVLFGATFGQISKLYDFKTSLNSEKITSKFYKIPVRVLEIIWNKLHILPVETLSGEVDIFHTSDWMEPPSYCPKVTTIHDLIVLKYPELFPKNIVGNHKLKHAWIKRESKYIIADSLNTKKDIIELLNIPETNIEVIYPGISSIFTPQIDEIVNSVVNKYNLNNKYILTVAKREPRKNLSTLIEAFQKLSNASFDLVIVGNYGWDTTSNISGKNIKLVGFVPDKDLPALYSGASCFVYPSTYEGFGFPVLEAMACGTKVITTNKGSLGEITGGFATVIDPEQATSLQAGIENALNTSISQTKKQEQISWTSKFNWKASAVKIIDVYKKALK